jgi:iron complex transport system permease protein
MGGAGGMLGGAQSAIAISVYSSHWLVRLGLTGAAFVGAVLAVLLTLVLARGVQHTLRLLLAGRHRGRGAGGAYLAHPAAVARFAAGHAGVLAGLHRLCRLDVVPADGRRVAAVPGRGLAAGARARWPGAGRSHGAEPGLALAPLRAALVAVLALATGTAVAQTGLIAFVGLAAPHLVRAAVSVPHGRLMLLSSLMGGALLAGADLLARGLLAPQELPVGVLTAVLGGGYLLWLMHRRETPP